MKSNILIRGLVALALTVGAVGVIATSQHQQPAQACYGLKELPFSAIHHHQQTAFPRIPLWESTSGNWSGYAVPLDTSGVKDTYSEVSGSWVVPTVTGVNGATSDTYSSDWVGIDGYNSGSVEQTGTEEDWTGTAQSNYAWFEMYPNPGYEITGFPVDPGDVISATVTYTGQKKVKVDGKTVLKNVFKVTIKNTTKKVQYLVPASYTAVPAATSVRSSAEWVVEAPYNAEILPLADFGTATFSSCQAASTLSGGVLKPINFWTPDPLTMIDPEGGMAVPTSLTANGEGFSVSWSQ